jgi:hypothetical protein
MEGYSFGGKRVKMKRILCILAFFILFTKLFGQIPYQEKIPRGIQFFDVGETDVELGYFNDPNEPVGPSDFAIDGKENLYIIDWRNYRLLVLNKNKFLAEYDFINSFDRVDVDSNLILLSKRSYPTRILLLEFKDNVFEIIYNSETDDYSDYKRIDNIYLINNFVIIEETESIYSSIEISTDDQSYHFRDSQDTKEYLSSLDSGFKYNENNILFYNNLFFTKYSYGIREALGKGIIFTSTTNREIRASGDLEGIDKNGNHYFNKRNKFFIFTSTGDILSAFTIPLGLKTSKMTVDLDGNIYFIGSAENGHTLYEIERDW